MKSLNEGWDNVSIIHIFNLNNDKAFSDWNVFDALSTNSENSFGHFGGILTLYFSGRMIFFANYY